VGGADDHGRGFGEHCHRPLVRQAVGEEPLRGEMGCEKAEGVLRSLDF